MHIPRLYIEQELKQGDLLGLPQEKVHHITHVLRMREGELIILFNDTGFEFDANLLKITKKSVQLEVINGRKINHESPLKIKLGLAISRGQYMDYSIQKAVELGVYEITPLYTEFSNVKLQGKRLKNKLTHWQNIIISATEQCGRNRLARILKPVPFIEWLDKNVNSIYLILHPGSETSITGVTGINDELGLLVGPEGGFSENEVEYAKQKGCIPISLGPRILRLETAVVVGLTIIQRQWGDLN